MKNAKILFFDTSFQQKNSGLNRTVTYSANYLSLLNIINNTKKYFLNLAQNFTQRSASQ